MNKEQIELARHALGLPNRRRMSYRNHFVAGIGSEDWMNWMAMVAKKNAGVRDGNAISGGDPVFWLTLTGAQLALKRGEKLDPEDFPMLATGTALDLAKKK